MTPVPLLVPAAAVLKAGRDAHEDCVAGLAHGHLARSGHLLMALPLVPRITRAAADRAGKRLRIAHVTGEQILARAIGGVGDAEQFVEAMAQLDCHAAPVAVGQRGIAGLHGKFAHACKQVAGRHQIVLDQGERFSGRLLVGQVDRIGLPCLLDLECARRRNRVVGGRQHAATARQLLLGMQQGRGLLLHRRHAGVVDHAAGDAHGDFLLPYLSASKVSNNLLEISIILPAAW